MNYSYTKKVIKKPQAGKQLTALFCLYQETG